LNTAIDLVGVIGSKSLLTLAASGPDIARLTKELEDAAGAAAALAEIKLDNLSGDVTKLGSAWEGFILGIEDGTGILNYLSRVVIQGLTEAITFMGKAMAISSFMFKDTWRAMGVYATAGGKLVGGAFQILGGHIKSFANEALLAISKIPILGSGIDVRAAKRRIREAADTLAKGRKNIADAAELYQKEKGMAATAAARFLIEQKGKAIARTEADNAKTQATADADAAAKRLELAEAAAKKAEAKRKKDGETLVKLRQKIADKELDVEDKTDEEKLARKRERQLRELDDLSVSAAAKAEAEKEINDYYDALKADMAATKKAEQDEKDKVAEEARLAKQLEIDALELERLLANDQLTFDERERLQLEYLDKKLANDLASEKLTAEEKILINKKAEDAKDKVRKAEADASKDLKKKVLNDALDGAAASFGIAQEVAVAKMLMAAPEAISGSFKEAAKAYAPPLSLAMGALGAAGTVAPIIKGLADIKKNRFSKGGKNSGGSPGGTIDTSAISAGAAGISTDTVSSLAANNAARLGIDPSLGGAAGSAAASNVMGGASGNVVFSEAQYSSFQSQVGFVEDLTTVGG